MRTILINQQMVPNSLKLISMIIEEIREEENYQETKKNISKLYLHKWLNHYWDSKYE